MTISAPSRRMALIIDEAGWGRHPVPASRAAAAGAAGWQSSSRRLRGMSAQPPTNVSDDIDLGM
jgi:hypothetical protein